MPFLTLDIMELKIIASPTPDADSVELVLNADPHTPCMFEYLSLVNHVAPKDPMTVAISAAIEDDSSGGSDLHEEEVEGYRATQPKSAPDLIAFKIKIGPVLYKYQHQGMDTTPAYITDMKWKTWVYCNLASFLKEHPSLVTLLVEQDIPFLSDFLKSVKEKFCPRSETSSVESMDCSNHPDSDGMGVEEPVDSGFASSGYSRSLDQRVPWEEEPPENDAEVAHIMSGTENMDWEY
ncbi:uncharacterized protein [Apostichopus japonicus]|uniref:uncharacterized protein isoform X2 n=1 Tax=Stichopus japonicus TaxID=307972 RepID=UPI003AB79588